MRQLPTGTVTFLFTDVEGSTKLLHELGVEGYAAALAEHRRVLREAFAAHGGVEVDTQGDAFFVAFARAADALSAARDGQAALDGPIRVRMGVHTGEPLALASGEVRGSELARLVDVLLAVEEARQLGQQRLRVGLRVRLRQARGRHVEEAIEVDAHRGVQHAAHEFGRR